MSSFSVDAGSPRLQTLSESRVRNATEMATIEADAGLYIGSCWSESEEGTCGIANVLTVMRLRRGSPVECR